MKSEQGIARVRGVLRRRRSWVVGATAVVLVVGAVTVAALPPVYRAQAVLRVLETQPSKEYVAPTVAEQYGERLRTLRLAVTARPLLEGVVDRLHLDRSFGLPREVALEVMRGHLEVKVEGDDTFLLTYEDVDAGRAAEVTRALAEGFVEREVERRQQATAATTGALGAEVARLRPELERLQARVRDFKLAHDGALPEQQEENLRQLDQATMELNIQSTNLDTAAERRRQLLLGASSALKAQEAHLATALHDALTRYTEDHPEVRRIRGELERVQERRVADEQALRTGAGRDPELAALEREIARDGATIAALKQRQGEIRGRLAVTAQNGQALAGLTIDLEAVRAKYQAAIGKLHEAELAGGVERALRGLRFDPVEAAPRPLRPVRPDRVVLALGVALLALGAGLGAGFARDFADPSLHGPDEVVAALGGGERRLEVLACIPRLDEGGAGERPDGGR